MLNHITIVVTTHNASNYIEKSLESALTQDYSKFDVVFIDACSTDGTYEIAKSLESKYPNLTVKQNTVRKYQVENLKAAVLEAAPKSIIITLDGDDWFPHPGVLERVNAEYEATGCWMTYGTYREHPYRDVSYHYREYPLTVRAVKSFRNYVWLASHLRTFRRELFLKIKEEDLIDPKHSDYFRISGDRIFQYPMLEMCGIDRSSYIPEVLYVYNVENPLNESKQYTEDIIRIDELVKNMPSYPTLEKLYEDE